VKSYTYKLHCWVKFIRLRICTSAFIAEEYVCYACGMVSDYLPKEVADELSKSYR